MFVACCKCKPLRLCQEEGRCGAADADALLFNFEVSVEFCWRPTTLMFSMTWMSVGGQSVRDLSDVSKLDQRQQRYWEYRV
jgi:hypothetical protein